MSEHTKEPWGVVSEKWYLNGQPSIVGQNGAGFAVALMAPWGPAVNDSVDKREANARRIVACVNACAGIPTEAIEAGVVGELVRACKLYRKLDDDIRAGIKMSPLDWSECHQAASGALSQLHNK